MDEDIKRLFFGFSVDAPWPVDYPKGRIISEKSRHLTFAFLGNQPFENLRKQLDHFPHPEFRLGPVGKCDEILFLPHFRPRVVAHHISWLIDGETLITYQKSVLDWLESLGYPIDRRPLLSHVSIARAPFDKAEWKKSFEELPCMVTGIHLYESMGNLTYESKWELPLLAPFEELEHTADIAFKIRGKSPYELYVHGAVAMSFKFPHFIRFIEAAPIQDLNHAIKSLNVMIGRCDLEMGCPFKAVSYHSHMTEEPDGLLNWEMIVDV